MEPNSHLAARALHVEITRNWFDRVDMAGHARTHGISPTRLSTSFRDLFGRSPKQLQVYLRIDAAKCALRETEWSISDVSYECGFYDVVQLARMFRRAIGMTPSNYRRRAKQGSVRRETATGVRRIANAERAALS